MKKCSTLHFQAVRSLQLRTKTVTWLSDSITPYTDSDIRYTDSAIRYTDSCIRYTDSDIRYTDSATRYADSSSRSKALSRATAKTIVFYCVYCGESKPCHDYHLNLISLLVSLCELSPVPYLPLCSNVWKVGSLRGFLLGASNLPLT